MFSVAVLKKINAISGLFFATFVVLHLLAHYALLIGYEAANSVMETMRKIYQNFVVELVLLLSFVAHMWSNACLFAARKRVERNAKKDDDDNDVDTAAIARRGNNSTELRLHRLAGYVLAFFIFGHVFAVRIAPSLYMTDPAAYDYSFVGKAYELLPLGIFPIYYCVLGVAGIWHLVYGVHSALIVLFWGGSIIVGRPFPMLLKIVALANHLAIIGAVIALGHHMATTDLSAKEELHNDLFESMGIKSP